MSIPALDQKGLLPVGIHVCNWAEVEAAFCWNRHRSNLFNGLQTFIRTEWAPLSLPADLWINGSFTRTKDHPDDIDLVADLSQYPNEQAFPGVLLSLRRAELKGIYGVDFWVKHPLIPTDLTIFFQYTGLKAGAELGLDSKRLKGILRVAP